MLHYYRQSLYFLEGQEMTLSIREAEMAGQGAGVGGHRPGRRNRLRTAGGD